MKTSQFTYRLPVQRIAQHPVEPRHSARLLLAGDLTDWTVQDLPQLLRRGDLVVVNHTRVRAARLHGQRQPGGGQVELLLLSRQGDNWEALVKPARRLKAGSVVQCGPLTARLLNSPAAGKAQIRLDTEQGDVEAVIASQGEMPLPPYINTALEDPERYQTVFSNRVGSAAAPTAALHFTHDTLGRLKDRGVKRASVELQIGLDTFRPITSQHIEDHSMHSEWMEVPPKTVNQILETRQRGGRVVAIGTTVVRALEGAVSGGRLQAFQGHTRLYITPGYRFQVVDVLMTNFHLPGSSLLVLLSAFMGERWRTVYKTALARGYRFLSFGDAMLVEKVEQAEICGGSQRVVPK